MHRIRYSFVWLPLLIAACQQRPVESNAKLQVLIFDDPGPNPAPGQTIFTGENWNSPANAPNGDITTSLLACGAKKLAVDNADMEHTWSVTVPKPADPPAFLRCVSRRAGPMTFRIREEVR